MITLHSHKARDLANALSLRFEPPQQDIDGASYLALFQTFADYPVPFVLYSDLRGFRLDHAGEVAQNRVAKATRAAVSQKMRGLIMLTDTPTEKKRQAFANFWSIPVQVYDQADQAEAAFWQLYEKVMANG